MFEKYGSETLLWFLKNTRVQVNMYDICLVIACCSLLQNLLVGSAFEYWFVFCFTWAVGSCLTEIDGQDFRKIFSKWWKGEMKTIKYSSKGTIFD